MLIAVIFFAAISAVMLVLLLREDKKNDKLIEENTWLNAKIGTLNEQIEKDGVPAVNVALTVEGIMDAVRFAGYVPEQDDTWVRFMVSGESFLIDTHRLPQLFVVRDYIVDTKEYDLDLLKHAAHMMSDDLIMVKAVFLEDEKSCTLRFFVAAMDRNYASFKENLLSYINLIQEGRNRMGAMYDNLDKEKKEEEAIAANPILPHVQPEKKVMS